ncbi:hypothetical protein, partial [Rothia sp. P7208]|uniref:hypothetical protein n=1 Tax=Rothia sp. P7208 TaxID=3402660 RepID=UPI003AC1A00C
MNSPLYRTATQMCGVYKGESVTDVLGRTHHTRVEVTFKTAPKELHVLTKSGFMLLPKARPSPFYIISP